MTLILIIVCSLLLIIYGLWRWNTQAEIIRVNIVQQTNFVEDKFSHQGLERLLNHYVVEGNVNYQAWFDNEQDVIRLDQYLAAVAKFSPENSPQMFNQKNSSLIYWVYAYNAVVIKNILNNWPLSSVTDLTAPVEIIKGLGFFYKLKFIYGGEAYSLYQIENGQIFDGQSDPRVHFILNCGSGSCPVLRPQLPTGDGLEPFLAKAAAEFIADDKNLKIEHKQKTIYLSTIFKWNKDDFIRATKQQSLMGYLLMIADPPTQIELNRAKDYKIEFVEYDWSINSVDTQHEG